jgi:MerR family mercuric resistance operon transcriptional regulator
VWQERNDMDYYLRGQLATEAGVNFETLRYYEKINLLPEPIRNQSGYRTYSNETLKRLKLIKQAQNCGFSIEEIKSILIIIENPAACDTSSDEIIDRKMSEIDKRIHEMQSMKDMLAGIRENLDNQNCSYFLSLLND